MSWDLVRPTFLENWPVELKAISIPQDGIPLTTNDAIALGKAQVELWEWWDRHELLGDDDPNAMPGDAPHRRTQEISDALHEKIKRLIATSGAPGVFVRLGSRSPKDSFHWWRQDDDLGPRPKGGPWPISSGEEAMRLLLETSERVNDDLLEAVAQDYSPWIWVRAWQDIEPWQEFRCFVRDGQLIGISQYDYMERRFFPQLARDRSLYASAIMVFLRKRVLPVLHVPSAVVDVFVTVEGMPSGRGRKASAKLLEINPYFDLTDPCLFSWEELGDLKATDLPVVKIREEK